DGSKKYTRPAHQVFHKITANYHCDPLPTLFADPILRWPARRMTVVKTASQTRQTRVATVAGVNTPSNFAVVALAAKASLDQVGHLDVITSCPHLENLGMTYITRKTQAVKPMRENHWPHTFLLGPVIDYYIG